MRNFEALFDALLLTIRESVLITDSEFRIVRASQAFEAVTGIPAHELVGKTAAQLDSIFEQPALARLLSDACSSDTLCSATVALSGRPETWELSVTPTSANGKKTGGIAVLRPVKTEQREGFDALTGLPNRHLFVDRVEQALNIAHRGDKSLMVMVTSIDRFGEINDVIGESAGNRLLHEIAGRLRLCIRTTDTVAKLSGDHFAFVMHIAAIDDSVLLTEKILHAIEQPISLDDGKDVVITGSIGASIYPADGTSAEELLNNATVALHHAMQHGGNRSQFFSNEMNSRARHRLDVESGIRRALANREFLVYYQPKIDVNNRRVAGAEALVRWLDPKRGLVQPGEFIPIAEESGLIEQIGQWVLEETCVQSQRWQSAGLAPVCISVNVSARQFRNREFVASVEKVLQRTGLAPRWLELEITESMLMGDIAAIVARMEEIRSLGVSLSIDDFGTGYSSLSYLSRFPITTLKIDRAFITDVQSNPHTAEIARAIIGLSRGLNLEVVAEGAEVKEQVEFLREHGCDLVQGYFYSKPLPAEEFAAMLRNGL